MYCGGRVGVTASGCRDGVMGLVGFIKVEREGVEGVRWGVWGKVR